MSLVTLKNKLQEALSQHPENEWDGSEGYREAISDALYATSLSEIALTQWIKTWEGPTGTIEAFCDWRSCLDTEESQYYSGVQFVADVWNKIKGGE